MNIEQKPFVVFIWGCREEMFRWECIPSQGGKNKMESFFSPTGTEQTERLKESIQANLGLLTLPQKNCFLRFQVDPQPTTLDTEGGAVAALRRTGPLTPPGQRYPMAATAAACPGEPAPASASGSRGVRVWGVGSEWPRGSERSGVEGGRQSCVLAGLLAPSLDCL